MIRQNFLPLLFRMNIYSFRISDIKILGGFSMFKIMQTNQYDNYYNIVFTYEDECFLAAGKYENDQIHLNILDAIDKEDIKENMLETGYICYYSLFNDVEGHGVLQHIEEVLSTGIRFDKELVN